MSLAVAVTNHWSDGKRLHATGTITASNNYAATGDALSFGLQEIKSTKTPLYVEIHGNGVYNYSFVPGSDITNGKMKIMITNTGLELGAGAYPVDVTGDAIVFHATFRKLI